MKLHRLALTVTTELLDALAAVAEERGLMQSVTVERIMWDHPDIQRLARRLKIKNPKRPDDARGRWKRKAKP